MLSQLVCYQTVMSCVLFEVERYGVEHVQSVVYDLLVRKSQHVIAFLAKPCITLAVCQCLLFRGMIATVYLHHNHSRDTYKVDDESIDYVLTTGIERPFSRA